MTEFAWSDYRHTKIKEQEDMHRREALKTANVELSGARL
jgi:hypothetical protein